MLKQKISDTKLTSPIDGRIDYLNEDLIKEGKIFNASWVYTISSGYKDLNISLSIDGREITKVDLGQEVEFSVENKSNTKFSATDLGVGASSLVSSLFNSVIRAIAVLYLNSFMSSFTVFNVA